RTDACGWAVARIRTAGRAVPPPGGASAWASWDALRSAVTSCNSSAAVFYCSGGAPDAARRSYEQARGLYRALGEKTYEACAESNLAQLELDLGRPEAALAALHHAIPVLTAAGDRDDEANARLTEGRARRRLGDLAP